MKKHVVWLSIFSLAVLEAGTRKWDFVVECLEGKAEFIEDEEEMDQRHLFKRVSSFTKGLWLYGFKKICKKGDTSKAFYVNVLWSKFFPRFLYKTFKFLVSCIKTTKGARKN